MAAAMKALVVMAAEMLLALAPGAALAQTVGGVLVPPIPAPGNGSLYPGSGSLFPSPTPQQSGRFGGGGHRGFNRGFGGGGFYYYEEPYVVHDVVYVHDQPAAAPAPPPPPPEPREAYVLGHSYGSLPGGCLKMIEGGESYFHCSGEWYRQVGAQYLAVAMP